MASAFLSRPAIAIDTASCWALSDGAGGLSAPRSRCRFGAPTGVRLDAGGRCDRSARGAIGVLRRASPPAGALFARGAAPEALAWDARRRGRAEPFAAAAAVALRVAPAAVAALGARGFRGASPLVVVFALSSPARFFVAT